MCHPFSRPTLERLFCGIQFGMDDWGERELSQLAADSGRLMPGIYRAACVCGPAAAWDKPRSGQNAGSPSEIRRKQWEALTPALISPGEAHDAWR